MLRIKSAQYMSMSPKPMPGDANNCRLCNQPKYQDELNEGFCEECLRSGMVKECINCRSKMTEDEAAETEHGPVCHECAADLYNEEGRYSGPRNTYYSGPAEWY